MMLVSLNSDRGRLGGAKQSPESSPLHRMHGRSHRIDALEVFRGEVSICHR